MAHGPGRYDDIASALVASTGAQVVCLIVCGGSRGSGFSLSCLAGQYAHPLPRALREVADQIEADLARMRPPGKA